MMYGYFVPLFFIPLNDIAWENSVACQDSMAKKSFESALARLEQITGELEEGELSLEKSLKKFDEGITLVHFCNQKLEEARSRVDLLLKKDNTLAAEPFNEEQRGDQDLPE